jgi:AAA domain
MSSKTRHLILIGDRLQLRPKVETYSLRAESGSGYDLDTSLFERLLLANYPQTALQQQHRMPSEISALVRGIAYPEVPDAPSTSTRPPVSGLRNRLVFVPHSRAEAAAAGSAAAAFVQGRVNVHEARMVAATVKYLLQQGVYKPQQIVVLTPYMAQLRLLRDELNASGTGALVSGADSADLLQSAAATSNATGSAKQATAGNTKRKGSSGASSSGSAVKLVSSSSVRCYS